MPETARKIPRHVAVIMDGNGRWAAERNLPRIKGHEQGAQAVRACAEACEQAGVEYLTVYAFSSENWKRPPSETSALMALLEGFLQKHSAEMRDRGIRFHTIGRVEDLPESCRLQIARTKQLTASQTKFHLVFALSYGARLEITEAVRKIARQTADGTLAPEQIDETTISNHLDTAGMPDPDLLVRTSGEMRLSNFLLWQISYAELYVTPVLWPDFTKDHMLQAIAEYGNRRRRFGGL